MSQHSVWRARISPSHIRTVSPVDLFTPFRTEPYVPSPSCLVILYRFIERLNRAGAAVVCGMGRHQRAHTHVR